MINVSIKKKDALICEILVKGHANYAKKGYDIICAAVSSIVQTAILGLEKVLFLEDVCYKTHDGYLKCKFEPTLETDIIMNTMLLGLYDVAKQYPNNINILEA